MEEKSESLADKTLDKKATQKPDTKLEAASLLGNIFTLMKKKREQDLKYRIEEKRNQLENQLEQTQTEIKILESVKESKGESKKQTKAKKEPKENKKGKSLLSLYPDGLVGVLTDTAIVSGLLFKYQTEGEKLQKESEEITKSFEDPQIDFSDMLDVEVKPLDKNSLKKEPSSTRSVTPETPATPATPEVPVKTEVPEKPKTIEPEKPSKVPTESPKASETPSTATKVEGPKVTKQNVGTLTTAASYIAKHEGVAQNKQGEVVSYWDPPGHKDKLVSIGYGHQIQPEEYKQGFLQIGQEKVPLVGERGIGTKITKDQAKELLKQDIPKYEERAKKPMGSAWEKLSDNQKTALISYAYNVGSTKSLVEAGLVEAILKGDTKEAERIIRERGIRTAKGVEHPGLVKRRAEEANLFASSDLSTGKNSNTPIPPAVPATGDTIATKSSENSNAKADAKTAQNNVTNNTMIQSQQNTKASSTPKPKEDDRPAYLKKAAN